MFSDTLPKLTYPTKYAKVFLDSFVIFSIKIQILWLLYHNFVRRDTMEKYTLRELINNKEAQAHLLETGFFTSGWLFGGMCYPEMGLQEILMAVFESIEEYGEDEVLERMFEAGGTCLTNDPKAAKSGVKPAGNSKKYFVKSNMGSAMKFSAILKAMMSYETHQMPEKVFGEPFSADELIFSTEPVNTEWTIWDNGVDLEEDAALAAWEPLAEETPDLTWPPSEEELADFAAAMDDTMDAMEWDDSTKALGTLDDQSVYAKKKDFYWALFIGLEQVTPYVFTSVEGIWNTYDEPEDLNKKPYINLEQFGRYGLYDLKKKAYALPCEYDKPFNIRYGSEGYFWMHKNGKVGLYSPKTDKIVLSCEYDLIYTETTYVFNPVKNGKVGWFDTNTNKLIIPCDFEYVEDPCFGGPVLYTLVQQNGKFGLYYTNGDHINPYLMAIPCDYDKIERLWDDEYKDKYVYKVWKGPFTGIYNVTNRTWIEHLHKA